MIVPLYNEAGNVNELCGRLLSMANDQSSYKFNFLMVENGSTDGTLQQLEQWSHIDFRVKIIKLSRNFRMDGGVTAGLSLAKGDAVVIMAGDLQDPPEMIPKFIEKWEQGIHNVYGRITKRHGTGIIRRINSRIFYKVIGRLTSGSIPENASDFRLMDRKLYETVRSLDERNRFVRGLIAWVGFSSEGIEMERPNRFAGDSKAFSTQVIDLALKGILSNSIIPLRFVSVFGLITFSLSTIAIFPLSIIWYLDGVPFAGFGSIIAFSLILISLLSIMLGIIAEYIGLIYQEVKQRPNFVLDYFEDNETHG